ncbi:MAG: iron-containing alcohol dehydrogenase [Clostridia bacterium]|nr:iron-containing alcohol dehydrogenase [Clostridia bacterium]
MLNFEFCSPTHFVFGKDAEAKTGALVKQYGGTKVLIHYGGGSAVRSGLLDRVEKSLTEEGILFETLGGVQPNPRSSLVYEGIDLCRKTGVDFILAVGGGSVIDSAKAIAAGVLIDGDFWQYWETKTPVPASLPIGTVLTIPAAGSESSHNSVITNEKTMVKRGTTGQCLRPKFSVLNPELTFTLPAWQTASGASDIIAHVLERYFTNTEDVEVTDRLCEALLLTMVHETPRVIEDPTCYEARANIMWAGALAHNNVVGVGREQDWATHALEHELSALRDVTHGAGLAVLFPAWMEKALPHNPKLFAKMATRIFGIENTGDDTETGRLGICAWRDFFHTIGMPSTLRELGMKEEDLPYMANRLMLKKDGTFGNFIPLTPADAEEIYRACF